MNLLYILIAAIIGLVLIFFFIYHSTSSTPLHTITYDGNVIYKGNTIPPISSDGSTYVLIGTSIGLIAYNIDTNTSTKVNQSIALGLAYDDAAQQFMELEADGTLSTVMIDGAKLEIGTGYTVLYDTMDGYLITVGGVTSVTGASGTTAAANGAYGVIQLKIT